MTIPPIESWRLTNWQNKHENVELFRRVREDLTDDDIAELFMALEIILENGTFKTEDLHRHRRSSARRASTTSNFCVIRS